MSRHRKGFWTVLAERLSAPPQPKPKPPPQVEEMRGPEDWCAEYVKQLEAAHDADTFQACATTVYSMIRYEPDNDHTMSMYLPDIILALGEKAGEIGEARPQDQDHIMWCMGEIQTLVDTHYDPPPAVREVLETMVAPAYDHILLAEEPEDVEEPQGMPLEPVAPTHWTERPPGLRKAAEIIAWHVIHGVPMPPVGIDRHEDVLERARSEGRW